MLALHKKVYSVASEKGKHANPLLYIIAVHVTNNQGHTDPRRGTVVTHIRRPILTHLRVADTAPHFDSNDRKQSVPGPYVDIHLRGGPTATPPAAPAVSLWPLNRGCRVIDRNIRCTWCCRIPQPAPPSRLDGPTAAGGPAQQQPLPERRGVVFPVDAFL